MLATHFIVEATLFLCACAYALAPPTGNDGGGSVRIPSALCGLVGLKPTFARVQDSPTSSIFSSVGVQGPLTSCVRDALLVYAVIANNCASVLCVCFLSRSFFCRPCGCCLLQAGSTQTRVQHHCRH